MSDSTAAFFEDLGQRRHEPLLQKAAGSVRFEITQGKKTDRWLVTIVKGDVHVSRRNVGADCVVRADRVLFDRIVAGRQNAVAAVLRGDLAVEGDWRFLVLIQRLFPGPPASRKRRRATSVTRSA